MQEFCDTASRLNIGYIILGGWYDVHSMQVHQDKMNEVMNQKINDVCKIHISLPLLLLG